MIHSAQLSEFAYYFYFTGAVLQAVASRRTGTAKE